MKSFLSVATLLVFAVLLIVGTAPTFSKLTTFTFEKQALNHKWLYLDAFVFDNLGANASSGHISWQFKNIQKQDPTALKNLAFSLFDDEDNSWPAVWKFINQFNGVLSVENCTTLRKFSKLTVSLSDYPEFDISIDEGNTRFWYMALDACERDITDSTVEFIELDFSWLNPGGYFQRQFSKDRQGIPEVHLTFVPFLTIMVLAYIVSVVQLVRSQSFHLLVRVFYASLVVYWLGRLVELIHLLVYGSDGVGIPFFDSLSVGLKLLADFLMIVLLFLIASGWTITTSYIRYFKPIIGVWVFLGVFYVALFIWAELEMFFVVSTEDYVYDTVPGIIITILRVPLLIFFEFVLFKTHQEETNSVKKLFYKVVGVLYGLWFIALPIIVSISFAIPIVHRAKWTEGISLTVDLISYGVMFIVLWYQLARKYFQLSTHTSTTGSAYETL
ncbi:hypothetical protein FDP41_006262 [Naegleria fowleri]|uniref:GPR180/TMEM145 transmembrane domain-containing protein n=1 Tax=Naegleria fowleri TaxID=5763 RepID=A0A6A5BKT7_NAEFO|nr:uncharacterized protein FDP41_006262 [Naegleria fowleri]KAF0974788.1 hypothetical protein FDP41_006262 [Naegleria fowleri]